MVSPQFDAGAHQARDFVLGVGCQHDERGFRRASRSRRWRADERAKASKQTLSLRVCAASARARPAPQLVDRDERLLRNRRRQRRANSSSLPTFSVAHRVARVAALFDVGEPVVQRLDEQVAALRVVEQVLLEVRVAPDDPDVAEHFVQHAGRAAGAPFGAEVVEQGPAFRAEQADHDLAIGERRVVVRDLAQPRRRIERVARIGGEGCSGGVRNGVHGGAHIELWTGHSRPSRPANAIRDSGSRRCRSPDVQGARTETRRVCCRGRRTRRFGERRANDHQ